MLRQSFKAMVRHRAAYRAAVLTAEGAINVVRNRAQLPNISAAYTASKDIFMGEIMRERAVELAFESHRYFDLRRWNISGNAQYLQKTALDFDRGAMENPSIYRRD